MATQVLPRAEMPRETARWKWPLLALSALAAIWILVAAINQLGLGGPPWYGWWDSFRVASDRSYNITFVHPRPGGATIRAGIHMGDRADAREQSFAGRVVMFTQPLTTESIPLVVHRGAAAFTTHIRGSTMWDGEPFWKLVGCVPQLLAGIWFLACAMLIILRRSEQENARTLALILLCIAPGFFVGPPVAPNPAVTLLSSASLQIFGCTALVLLVLLSSRFGVRSWWRLVFERVAYAVIALDAIWHAAFYFAIVTLRIDPVPYWSGVLGVSLSDIAATLVVALTAAAAVFATPSSERPRSGWLLVPLPVALLASALFDYLGPFAATWIAAMALEGVGFAFVLTGALAVTYALVKRRVLDFEFVLSRTLVVATVSAIVVVSFVLLEWLLGTVVAGVSHATGLIANGSLALVLGLSLRYIHKRVDVSVDSLLFRKRHDDDRALHDFSVEAAYVTESDALLDQTIANIRDHTDARSAAVLLEFPGTFRTQRSFGDDGVPQEVGENDPAILALKTWHKPLDPHRCATALHGALALPMMARGRLLGVILLGERAGGEAYAPGEIEALSQVAQGVGSTLDALRDGTNSIAQMHTSLTALADGMASLGEKIDSLSQRFAGNG